MTNDIITLDDLPVEKALSLFVSGMTREEACQEVGISTRTLQRYLHENPEAQIKVMQTKQKELLPYYDRIVQARVKLIQDLVLAVDDEDLDLKTRSGLLKDLGALQKELEQLAGFAPLVIQQGPSEAAKETSLEAMNYLKSMGPKLTSGKVTITQTKMEVEED